MTRAYLDELPPAGADQFGMGILELMASSPEQAVTKAKTWLERANEVKKPVAARRKLVELIETVIAGHFQILSREELERMLQIKDFRETRVYREALEEGRQEGREEGEKNSKRLLFACWRRRCQWPRWRR